MQKILRDTRDFHSNKSGHDAVLNFIVSFAECEAQKEAFLYGAHGTVTLLFTHIHFKKSGVERPQNQKNDNNNNNMMSIALSLKSMFRTIADT